VLVTDQKNERSLEYKKCFAAVSVERFLNDETEDAPATGGDSEDFYDEDFVPPLPRQMVSRSNSTTKRLSDSDPVVINKDFHVGHIAVDDG